MIIKKGTSIIEIVIAAALISVAIIAALSLTSQSQKQNNYARKLAEATKYATQLQDWIINERNDLGWTTLSSVDAGIYCLNDLPADFTQMESGSCDQASFIPNTVFRREIDLTKTIDTINIVINLKWTQNIERNTSIEMELTSWY